jgi:predicted HTH transcriptional regulator
MTTAEDRFLHLQDLPGIQALIGQTEDLHLDCKEWPSRDDDAQRVVPKAISGFANADGGCLVIGAQARSLKKMNLTQSKASSRFRTRWLSSPESRI